jgi:hypothetical protein
MAGDHAAFQEGQTAEVSLEDVAKGAAGPLDMLDLTTHGI